MRIGGIDLITGLLRQKAVSFRACCFYSLLVFAFSITFSNALAEISSTAAIVFFFLAAFQEGRRPLGDQDRLMLAALGGYTLIVLLSLTWSEARHASLRGIIKVVQEVLIFLAAAEVLRKEKGTFIESFFAAVLAVTVLNCFFQYLAGWDFLRGNPYVASSAGRRITASFKTYTQLGCFLTMVIPYIAATAWRYPVLSRRRLAYLAIAGAGCVCLYLTRSRGAACSLILAFFFFLLLRRNFKLLALLALCAAGILALTPRSMILHLDVTNKEQSLVERMYLWERALNVIEAKPLTGTGINTYLTAHAKYDKKHNWRVVNYYAHNGYLQMAAEVGIPGVSFFLIFLIRTLYTGWRSIRNSPDINVWMPLAGLWIGTLAFMIFAAVDTGLHNIQAVLPFFLVLGLLTASAADAGSLDAGTE